MLSRSILKRKAFQLKAKTSIISNINSITWIVYHDTISIWKTLPFSSFSSRPSNFTTASMLHVKADISRIKINFMKHGIISSQHRSLFNETTLEHNNNEQIISKMTRQSRVTSEIKELRRKQQKFCDEHLNKDHVSLELLEDFPAWLDNLGLKFFAPCFKDKKWQDIIEMYALYLSVAK
ncbi:8172_t:CDS:2 [Dentiscutata erythropus]|uniref:8172_t:CDS:1 n=1 Tax=Dentiscutata erythropus TaxID=1348616 RepID=A0A9N9BMF8_9GLOM|nr:8172_t:CDS:2 [Dentiscutata erythropus]